MQKNSIACWVLVALSSYPLIARGADEPAAQDPPAMTDYQLVFLYKNEDWKPPDDEPASRSTRIENNQKFQMEQLLKAGGALIGGEILDGVALKTVAVLDLEDVAQAQQVFDGMPGVQTGRLKARAYAWSAQEGILKPPSQPEDTVSVWLGLLERPSNAPRLPPEELERIQQGHLANLTLMHESGDLVIAGPIENGEELRGILIFRTEDRERIEKLVGEDPAVQAGRLTLELYRWQVPRSSLPDAS